MPLRKKTRALLIILGVLLGCTAMACFEMVRQPSYFVKAVIKFLLFGLIILGACLVSHDASFLQNFRWQGKRQFLRSLCLGFATFALILAGFYVFRHFINLKTIAHDLIHDENITARGFLPVSVYICLINSFLEEIFFRGFAYLELRRFVPEPAVSAVSILAFSAYHIAIISGWFSPWIALLILSGLALSGWIFNRLDRCGSLYPSWIVHMSANAAINLIGLMMFGYL